MWARNSLLRLPGTFNWKAHTRDETKPGTPVIWAGHIEGERLSAEELGRLLPPDSHPGDGSRPVIGKKAKRVAGEPDRTRSGWQWHHVGQLVRRGLSDEEIHERVRGVNGKAVAKWGEGEQLRRQTQRCIDKWRSRMNGETAGRQGVVRVMGRRRG
jgi:hypothetical protein